MNAERKGRLARRVGTAAPVRARLGAAAIGRNALVCAAQPPLECPERESGETVALFQRRGGERICIASAQITQDIRHALEVGQRRPLLRGAAGKR